MINDTLYVQGVIALDPETEEAYKWRYQGAVKDGLREHSGHRRGRWDEFGGYRFSHGFP